MGFLNNIFKNNRLYNEVSINKNRLFINNKEIVFPIHIDLLIEIFGEPSRYDHDLLWNVAWDNIGVFCFNESFENIFTIRFLQSKMSNNEFAPINLFRGKLVVNNENFTQKKFTNIEFEKIALSKMKYKDEEKPCGFYIGMNHSYKEEIPKDKYLIPQPKGDIIEFNGFIFKLAIIQELMYNQEILTPKFDLYEFAEWYKEREIDIEKEGYEFIPEVVQYFTDLPIKSNYAHLITEIYQDGGDEIYSQLIPFWTGEEDDFNIQSAEDAIHFPNLKKVTLFYEDTPKVINEFIEMKIEANYL